MCSCRVTHKAADVAFLKSASLESASFSSLLAYSNSKLANVAFATEFSRRFKIDAVSLHPSVIASNFRAKLAPKTLADRFLVRGLFPVIDAFVWARVLSRGATTSVWLRARRLVS